jgi:multidrug resistance efflux pump
MDSANLASEIEQLELQMRSAEQRAQKELAELEVARVEAERAQVEAEAKQAKAAIDAGVPAAHLAAIQYERFQLDLERAIKELAEARAKRETAQAAIGKRNAEFELERQTLELDLGRKREQLTSASLRAERSGAVLYATDRQTGNKLGVGANVQFSTLIAEVTEAADLVVVAWLNEVDGLRLPSDAAARLTLDAQPDQPFEGRLRSRSGGAEAREAWGDSRYFELEFAIDPPADLSLTPGMSVLVEVPLLPTGTPP